MIRMEETVAQAKRVMDSLGPDGLTRMAYDYFRRRGDTHPAQVLFYLVVGHEG